MSQERAKAAAFSSAAVTPVCATHPHGHSFRDLSLGILGRDWSY